MVRGWGHSRVQGWHMRSKVGRMTYIVRVLCREVFYRWDGTLGNKLPVRRRCLLLHDLSLHPGEGGKYARRRRASQSLVTPSEGNVPKPRRPLPSIPRPGQMELCHGLSKVNSLPSLRLLSQTHRRPSKVGLLSLQEQHWPHLTLSPHSATASPTPTDLYSWVRMA